MTANQLYKQYKDEGGTLNFAGWLNREKKKGVFPINKEATQEVYAAMNGMPEKTKGLTFGFPTTTLIVVGVLIIGAVVAVKIMKKK